MRTKGQHLDEIERQFKKAKDLRDSIRVTRTNVPAGSTIHRRLKRTEDALHDIINDLEFTFHSLDQNHY